MKLKCDKHNRRVLSVSNSPSFLHRTGDMSKCDSKTASMTDTVSKTKRTFVVMAQKHDPKTFDVVSISTNKLAHNPAEDLLHEIFGDPEQISITRNT